MNIRHAPEPDWDHAFVHPQDVEELRKKYNLSKFIVRTVECSDETGTGVIVEVIRR